MFRYVVQRLGIMIPTLLVISFLVFVIIQAPPGSYIDVIINELQSQGAAVNPAKIAAIKAEYGLDQPFFVQYLTWIGHLLQGNMGYSFEYNLPVAQLVGDKLLLTMVVSISTILFIWVVSFPIAIYSATHQYSLGDYLASFIGFIGLATPSFLLALVLLYFAHVWFGISVGGLMDPAYLDQPWSWAKVQSLLAHLWIPIIVIGTSGTAGMIRRLRANLLDELQKQYVTTGRAKGLPPGACCSNIRCACPSTPSSRISDRSCPK